MQYGSGSSGLDASAAASRREALLSQSFAYGDMTFSPDGTMLDDTMSGEEKKNSCCGRVFKKMCCHPPASHYSNGVKIICYSAIMGALAASVTWNYVSEDKQKYIAYVDLGVWAASALIMVGCLKLASSKTCMEMTGPGDCLAKTGECFKRCFKKSHGAPQFDDFGSVIG
jgi:hypothetical protein